MLWPGSATGLGCVVVAAVGSTERLFWRHSVSSARTRLGSQRQPDPARRRSNKFRLRHAGIIPTRAWLGSQRPTFIFAQIPFFGATVSAQPARGWGVSGSPIQRRVARDVDDEREHHRAPLSPHLAGVCSASSASASASSASSSSSSAAAATTASTIAGTGRAADPRELGDERSNLRRRISPVRRPAR